MDAPVYQPAQHFTAPVRQPRTLNSRDVSIADLLAVPAAKALILKEMPGVGGMLKIADLQPHMGNLTLWDLVNIGLAKGDRLGEIDRQLALMENIR